jgi:serine/threonine protein kinase
LHPQEVFEQAVWRELQMLVEGRHKNVVNLLHAFELNGETHFMFEYAPHTILKKIQEGKDGRLPCNHVAYYTRQMVQGLQHLHSRQVIRQCSIFNIQARSFKYGVR